MNYHVINVSDEDGIYRLEIDSNLFTPKIVNIYCNKTPKCTSSYKYKICSLCIVGEDINIFPHENDILSMYDTYHLIKNNVKKILDTI
ncbi:gp496 [Bacillus phage G]|uniref:Gp496 n=1 Tax=Bacillus phage G TaxID=2884420 RepID=G3MAN7_9CAUD|nr:gp496 [Bacillus phage G]AEO93754.1 gp496 [Bacillus phage G]